MILSPDYQENLKRKDEDETDAREGALKMALHFLLEMERTDLADKLKDHELYVRCRAEFKLHLKNKYQNVFEGIPMQGNSALLDKIYTEIYITEGGSGKVNEEHEVRQIESISKIPAGEEKQIRCSDIFKLLPGQDKPSRSVMTKGVAGIGKTISIQKYILDWAEGKDNREIHFIFPLPFRELNLMRGTQISLIGLLHHFFPELKQLTFDSQEKYKLLFIFDGLDECRLKLNFQENESWTDVTGVTSLDVLLTNLIKGNLLPSALLWITSRPAAASQIPPDCVDLVTEIQGFNDIQKEEYFRNRFNDENVAERIMSHIKSSRSLHIMCHIPVFCWITAYVLEVIFGSSGRQQLPKTLTEMYTYFLIFHTKQASQKFDNVHELDPQWNKNLILSLGKLAYKQLEKGNLIFYEEDLEECGIDVREAAVCSGVCTQIFRQESGLFQATVFCFIHLSVQEYLAALFVFLKMANERQNVISAHKREQTMSTLHKIAVDKALEYKDGRFDLFLRFLLGLSLESNQTLLHGLLWRGEKHIGNAETISYIKGKIRKIPSSERVINLFHCLNELKDHSLVEEIQSFLSKGTLSKDKLSPGQWAALVFVLLTSDQKLDVFDLKKYVRSDEGLRRLKPVVEESEALLLDSCGLSDMSCTTMASVLCKASKVKKLDLSHNRIGNSGVKQLCSGLKNSNCTLESLRLDSCGLSEMSCTTMASVLCKASSKVKTLDLSHNCIGDIGVKELCSGLKNSNCALESLRLEDCGVTGVGYAALTSALKSNPSHLEELDLRGNDPGDSGVKLLLILQQDPACKLQTLRLLKSDAAEQACAYLTSILHENPLLLTELDLSGKIPGDSGVKQLCALLEDSHCRIKTLKLDSCSITEEGCAALTSSLASNPSHLGDLNLSCNKIGDSGVQQISTLLLNPDFKPWRLWLESCSVTEEGCAALSSALISNPSHLTRLNLDKNKLGDSGVKTISTLLRNPDFKLQLMWLEDCSLTEEGCAALTSALISNPSHLTELSLSNNKLEDSDVKQISTLLRNPDCKLQTLALESCSITEEGCAALTSALISNPSHLTVLGLSNNKLGDSGVKQISALLRNPDCKLQTLA
ncbi:NACHT, LRR and PYD domains-containing protein 12-like [Engraulis encrasicolus]|uniref:NACHT, LRR and PYD domains-containing protein 12-like n=1 Tax=Engraulis encrasicolus TaxID=184585 RepID=UPI002FCF071A